MKYNVAFKHMEKITKNASAARPILRGIHHIGDVMEATDSHRALITTVDKMDFEEHVLDPQIQKELEGAYPNLAQLAEHTYHDNKIELEPDDIKAIKDMLKVAKTMKFKCVDIIVSEEGAILKASTASGDTSEFPHLNKINMSYQLTSEPTAPHIQLNEYSVSLQYMLDIFEFLVDTKKGTTLNIHESNMRPMHFTSNDYNYLVLPIRRY